MCFFYVDKDFGGNFRLGEGCQIRAKDSRHNSVGSGLVDLWIASRLIDNDESPGDKIAVNFVRVISPHSIAVLFLDTPHHGRAVAKLKHAKHISKPLIRPWITTAPRPTHILRVESIKASISATLDKVVQGLHSISCLVPRDMS